MNKYRVTYHFRVLEEKGVVTNKISEIVEAKNPAEARRETTFRPTGDIVVEKIKEEK